MDATPFQFQQFSVQHDRSAMKVGTDGVLLGAWTDSGEANRILDVGTGCGLIALMLAQRNSIASIDAVEVDLESAKQAAKNVASSPWSSRINVIPTSLQEWVRKLERERIKYDLIVSNPPFFANSLQSPYRDRNLARHSTGLSFDELLHLSLSILEPRGRISIIVPANRLKSIEVVARQTNLHLNQRVNVLPRPGQPAKRVLIGLSRERLRTTTDELVVESSKHVYSEQFKKLTEEFYLRYSD